MVHPPVHRLHVHAQFHVKGHGQYHRILGIAQVEAEVSIGQEGFPEPAALGRDLLGRYAEVVPQQFAHPTMAEDETLAVHLELETLRACQFLFVEQIFQMTHPLS